jgi:hypothetical protein
MAWPGAQWPSQSVGKAVTLSASFVSKQWFLSKLNKGRGRHVKKRQCRYNESKKRMQQEGWDVVGKKKKKRKKKLAS